MVVQVVNVINMPLRHAICLAPWFEFHCVFDCVMKGHFIRQTPLTPYSEESHTKIGL